MMLGVFLPSVMLQLLGVAVSHVASHILMQSLGMQVHRNEKGNPSQSKLKTSFSQSENQH